jgi:hypothetical protein
MSAMIRVLVLSDTHFACEAERERRGHETGVIANPVLRAATRVFRNHFWLRDPFAHNHLLDAFLARAGEPDLVVANGDLSCDTRFVGLSDDAAFESARQCLAKLRQAFGSRLHVALGDHELGKMSLFGGRGGLRLASWDRAAAGLGLEPFWQREAGRYVLLGITSSLLALPVLEPEALPEERARWRELRAEHLNRIREVFGALRPDQRLLIFCHDPTALPFLGRETEVRARLGLVERTFIGHLHSNLILWKSRLLAGMPPIHFLGNSIRRMSTALSEGRRWKEFHVHLCPSLTGIQLLKDGGFLELRLDPTARQPVASRVHRLPWT